MTYPIAEGALDGLTGQQRANVVAQLTAEAVARGEGSYTITRAEVRRAMNHD
jgi:hypothetical protein